MRAAENIGSICGESYGNISNCHNSANVHGIDSEVLSNVGGICGVFHCGNNIISDSTNSGSITPSQNVQGIGGIAGYAEGTDAVPQIINCHNIGKIQAYPESSNAIGGILGSWHNNYDKVIRINNCTNSGDIISENCFSVIGGIYGAELSAAPSIENCVNNGNIVASYMGSQHKPTVIDGLAGWLGYMTSIASSDLGKEDYIKHSYNTGNISYTGRAEACIGGLVGFAVPFL